MSDRIDHIVTQKFLAFPIFVMVMTFVYYVSIQTLGLLATDWISERFLRDIIPEVTQKVLTVLNVENWLTTLILDGIILGMGSVLSFIPQIFVLFLCLGILEANGYMSKNAFVMDRIFRKFGLSGKSFIPMLIATGYGVLAIMATRTIENEKYRRMSIMSATIMPCSAKLAIVTLISGAFFPDSPWFAPAAFFLGFFMIVFSSITLIKTVLLGSQTAPFIMELPDYHLQKAKTIIRYEGQKANSFAQRVGILIFSSSVLYGSLAIIMINLNRY